VAILLYHSIGDSPAFFNVTKEAFVKQLEFLKRQKYQVVPLSLLVEKLKKGEPLADKTVVLTFDDGYSDNFVNAWPALKEHNFPATIFLAAGHLGQLLGNSEGGQIQVLNEAQIKEMVGSGLIELASHTQSHPRLEKISDVDFAQEARLSKETIEKITGQPCRFFAYPRGYWRESFFGILQDLGYEAACSVQEGLIKVGDNPFCLKRNMVYGFISWAEFKGKLTQAVVVYNWLKNLLKKS